MTVVIIKKQQKNAEEKKIKKHLNFLEDLVKKDV